MIDNTHFSNVNWTIQSSGNTTYGFGISNANGSAAACRPRHAKLTLKYKHAATPTERQDSGSDYTDLYSTHPYLNINEWGVSDIEHDIKWLGLSGSPTKVKQIENVVFTAKESKKLTAADNEIEDLMKELIANHTIG